MAPAAKELTMSLISLKRRGLVRASIGQARYKEGLQQDVGGSLGRPES